LPEVLPQLRDGDIMPEQPAELKKLATIATDLELSAEMRIKAIELLGRIGTRDALLVLLELAANEKLIGEERDLALRQARVIIKSGR
jgi:hypothetical protein